MKVSVDVSIQSFGELLLQERRDRIPRGDHEKLAFGKEQGRNEAIRFLMILRCNRVELARGPAAPTDRALLTRRASPER